MDIDRNIERVRECKHMPEMDFVKMCELLKPILYKERNLIEVRPPVKVCGDVHGQFYDVLELFRIGGEFETDENVTYLFLGDFVDRGYYSVETLSLLLLYKLKYPDRIFLLRGNHESADISRNYGFYDECYKKYGSSTVWRYSCTIFDYLTLAAKISDSIFCIHGGLSPKMVLLQQLYTESRFNPRRLSPAVKDLLWSDPWEDSEQISVLGKGSDLNNGWSRSPRGAGWLFGYDVVRKFLRTNKLSLIIRSHQIVTEGYKFSFGKKNFLTVWSAPNYLYRLKNKASILSIDADLQKTFSIFKAVPAKKRKTPPRAKSLY